MYTATLVRGKNPAGPHPRYTCDRCGHESTRQHASGLCRDCRLVDPKVWERRP